MNKKKECRLLSWRWFWPSPMSLYGPPWPPFLASQFNDIKTQHNQKWESNGIFDPWANRQNKKGQSVRPANFIQNIPLLHFLVFGPFLCVFYSDFSQIWGLNFVQIGRRRMEWLNDECRPRNLCPTLYLFCIGLATIFGIWRSQNSLWNVIKMWFNYSIDPFSHFCRKNFKEFQIVRLNILEPFHILENALKKL